MAAWVVASGGVDADGEELCFGWKDGGGRGRAILRRFANVAAVTASGSQAPVQPRVSPELLHTPHSKQSTLYSPLTREPWVTSVQAAESKGVKWRLIGIRAAAECAQSLLFTSRQAALEYEW